MLSCMKNLDKQIKHLYILAQSNKEKHIQAKKQLSDLTQSIKFISERFDKFEKDRKEKQKVVDNLLEKVHILSNKDENMENSIGKQEQHSSRNSLFIHGIQEIVKKIQMR